MEEIKNVKKQKAESLIKTATHSKWMKNGMSCNQLNKRQSNPLIAYLLCLLG